MNTAAYDAFDVVADSAQVAESVDEEQGSVVRVTRHCRQLVRVDGRSYTNHDDANACSACGRRLDQGGRHVGGPVHGEDDGKPGHPSVGQSSAVERGEHAAVDKIQCGRQVDFIAAVRQSTHSRRYVDATREVVQVKLYL